MQMYEPPRDGDLKEVKIEVTRDCPLACVHCSSKAVAGSPDHLPKDVVISLVNQAADMGVSNIVLSGGEPLVWPWISEAVAACGRQGIHCSLYTTGNNGRGGGLRDILTLAECGLKKVVFSVYSPLREYHEQVTTKPGSFDTTLQTIKGCAGADIEIGIHFVPLKRNYKHLPQLVRLAGELDVSRISILRFVPQGRGIVLKGSREMLMHTESIELRDMIIQSKRDSGVEIRVGSPYNTLLLNESTDCIAARHTLSIGPTGNLYPCDAFKNTDPSDLNVNDEFNNILRYPLRECWERSEYLEAIRRYLSTPFDKPCSACGHLERCKSGCLAQKVLQQEGILEGNIMKQPDPLCLRGLTGGSDA